MTAVNHLLDHCATYPDDCITCRASIMVLVTHSDAGLHTESRSRSRADAHIFLSENASIPMWNGPLLTIVQITKYVVSSAAEAETTSLFLTAKEMVPLRNTLEEMGWKLPPSPLQSEKSTTGGMTNATRTPSRSKH